MFENDSTAALVALTPTTFVTPEDFEEWAAVCEEEAEKNEKVMEEHLMRHASEMMGLKFDGQNFYRVMGQFSPSAGAKVVVSEKEISDSYSRMMRDFAKYGCD